MNTAELPLSSLFMPMPVWFPNSQDMYTHNSTYLYHRVTCRTSILIFNRLLQSKSLQVNYYVIASAYISQAHPQIFHPDSFCLNILSQVKEINIQNYTCQERSQKHSNHKAYNKQKNNQKISLQKGKVFLNLKLIVNLLFQERFVFCQCLYVCCVLTKIHKN